MWQIDSADRNILARLKIIVLPNGHFARWSDITREEFDVLLLTVLCDLQLALKNKHLNDFINYGINHTVKCEVVGGVTYFQTNPYVYKDNYQAMAFKAVITTDFVKPLPIHTELGRTRPLLVPVGSFPSITSTAPIIPTIDGYTIKAISSTTFRYLNLTYKY